MPRATHTLLPRNRFAKRHYEAIATVIQHLTLSDDEHDEQGLAEIEARRQAIAREFANLFASDNGMFKRERFERACEPGVGMISSLWLVTRSPNREGGPAARQLEKLAASPSHHRQ